LPCEIEYVSGIVISSTKAGQGSGNGAQVDARDLLRHQEADDDQAGAVAAAGTIPAMGVAKIASANITATTTECSPVARAFGDSRRRLDVAGHRAWPRTGPDGGGDRIDAEQAPERGISPFASVSCASSAMAVLVPMVSKKSTSSHGDEERSRWSESAPRRSACPTVRSAGSTARSHGGARRRPL